MANPAWLNKYLTMKPEVVKIFDDLEAFHNFCRIELLDFNEAYLYNKQSAVWNQYVQSSRPRRPRGDYNRSGNYRARNQ